ncbi:IPT/TIG domain-containing protein [Archangium violaceum]|uniref:IPT/TIG domain-containing protein n=1 Tax=Archangium violaceum Cb vi76 TaxID=1406225 RepID=A0A084T0U0_9BACT|nr:IPT/TIG domain-containing protein [Archangium violaceum]KFA94325.1 hypothetical protein Q664_03245 [Archangium violaceum Cb vi76]
MSPPYSKIEPGSLITAELLNSMLKQLEEHEQRLDQLESALPGGKAGVAITAIFPTVPVRVGEELRLVGRNFGLPMNNVVTLAGKRVEQFNPGSSDTQLLFTVKPLPGLGEQSTPVQLTVSNPLGFASATVIVAPAAPAEPTGQVMISLTGAPQVHILKAGQSYDFIYTVTVLTNMDETFTFTPLVEPAWRARVVDEQEQVLEPAALLIGQGQAPLGTSEKVRVRLTIPPELPDDSSARLRLEAVSQRNPKLRGSSGEQHLKVGARPPLQADFPLALLGVREGATLKENEVVVDPRKRDARLDFQAQFLERGDYRLEPSVEGDPGGHWKISLQFGNRLSVEGPGFVRLKARLSADNMATTAELKLRIVSESRPGVASEVSHRIRLA